MLSLTIALSLTTLMVKSAIRASRQSPSHIISFTGDEHPLIIKVPVGRTSPDANIRVASAFMRAVVDAWISKPPLPRGDVVVPNWFRRVVAQPGNQFVADCPGAPWIILADDVKTVLEQGPSSASSNQQNLDFADDI